MKKDQITIILLGMILLFYVFEHPVLSAEEIESISEIESSFADKAHIDALKEGSGGVDINIRAGKEVKYTAGKDKLWFTSDDEIYHYFLADYDPHGRMLQKSCYVAGPGNSWFTSNDQLKERFFYGYDQKGYPAKEIHYQGAGVNDIIQDYYVVYEHSAQGHKIKAVRYNMQGYIIRYISYQYGAIGKISRDVEYNAAGPDRKWFTSDDDIEKYHYHDYDGQGRLTRVMEYLDIKNGKGADNNWFTSDDVISSTKVFICDNQGFIKQANKYIGAGPDNQWFTDDDVLQYYVLRYHGKIN